MKTALAFILINLVCICLASLAFTKPREHQAPLYACPEAANQALINATQLVVVTTTGWNAVDAEMRLFNRESRTTPWILSRPSNRAVVGKNGSAWGRNFSGLAQNTEPLKHEGDGRTPVGIHGFGERFGFARSQDVPQNWHYTALQSTTICVDDPKSSNYSKIVESSSTAKDWKTAEQMRSVPQYKMGIDINYLTDSKALTGSCIFFHIWKGQHVGTTGCTATDETHMRAFQDWLQDESRAAIAILPEPTFAKFAACFDGFNLED